MDGTFVRRVVQGKRPENVRVGAAYFGAFEHMNRLARTSGLRAQRILHTKGFPPSVWGNVPERCGPFSGDPARVCPKCWSDKTLMEFCKGNFVVPRAL